MTSILYPALISSIIETTITHPIDVIKIHKQTSKPIIYKFNTLYSGYIPRALGNIPSRTIFLFSQDYFDLCKVYIEINNEKGEVCFFDDLTMIKNIEYWFGAQFNGKKTFTIYSSNKTIVLFQITSI